MKKLNLGILFLIRSMLVIFISFILLSSCKKDDDESLNNTPDNNTTAEFNPDISYGSITDQDGNVYKTVTIGAQTWMAENLRTTKYKDGSAIPLISDDSTWDVLTSAGYCNYNNTTDKKSISTYGCLYNWYAVNTGKLAPTGWHIPTDDEWTELLNYLVGDSIAGGKLKENTTKHWESPNSGATNVSGFTALPAGYRGAYGDFYALGTGGYWWSYSGLDSSYAWYRYMGYDYENVNRGNYVGKQRGFSIRCIKD